MNAQTAHTPLPWKMEMEHMGIRRYPAVVHRDVADKLHGVCSLWSTPPALANAELIVQAVNSHALLVDQNEQLRSLLGQMLDAAENADETGYVADLGFIDLDKLHAAARAALNPPPTK